MISMDSIVWVWMVLTRSFFVLFFWVEERVVPSQESRVACCRRMSRNAKEFSNSNEVKFKKRHVAACDMSHVCTNFAAANCNCYFFL